jgi:hypothetical protein
MYFLSSETTPLCIFLFGSENTPLCFKLFSSESTPGCIYYLPIRLRSHLTLNVLRAVSTYSAPKPFLRGISRVVSETNSRCIYLFGFEATPLKSYSSGSKSLDVVSTSSTLKPDRAVMSTKYSAPKRLRVAYSALNPLNDRCTDMLRNDLVLHSILGSETPSPHSLVSLPNCSASTLTPPCAPKPIDPNYIM